MTDAFPCPACGFLTFSERPGSYEICDVCGWEDDHVQLAHPRLAGGANRSSLVEAQLVAITQHPVDVQTVGGYLRDPEWRPLVVHETWSHDDAPGSGLAYFHSAAGDEPIYYWRTRRER